MIWWWNEYIEPVSKQFRLKRLSAFAEAYPDLNTLSVLDVGGSPYIWELLSEYFNLKPKQVVLLNNSPQELRDKTYENVLADARQIPFPDKKFDLVFSNSVIEHVGDLSDQLKFVAECERVGKEIFIQTPNRWFPVEPHVYTMFLHWLPKPIYRRMAFLSGLYAFHISTPDAWHKTTEMIDGTNLLSQKDLQKLFPTKTILTERSLGLVKSFVVADRKINGFPVI